MAGGFAYAQEAEIPVSPDPATADVLPGGDLDCVDWLPRPDMFPHGLPWVTQQNEATPVIAIDSAIQASSSHAIGGTGRDFDP